ncbi:MAG: apolipoprotein N-acyltransferase, partial [Deltaproteobacteria bacterium]|nr:apolipoprotein N-acyltransferase [Deltaproteobacteria bacterium]
LVGLRGTSARPAWWRGFLTGASYPALSLYWLYTARLAVGGLAPWTAVLVLLLSIAILASFVGAAVGCARWISLRRPRDPVWLLPVVWVACDWLRNYFPFGGFPWSVLGQTQAAYLPLIQCADLTGVYGCTFCIVWVNRWLARVWEGLRAPEATEWRWQESATWATLGLMVFVVAYGVLRYAEVRQTIRSWPTYRVAMVQPNVPQEEKWTPGLEQRQLQQIHHVMQRLAEDAIGLILWPEASYPWTIDIRQARLPSEHLAPAAGARVTRTPMLIGAVGAADRHPSGIRYNSAFAVMPEGTIVGRYDKQHLVPFGEYIPLRRIFFFARRLTAAVGNFVPGLSRGPIHVGRIAVGPLICYEDIFPDIARAHARRGAQFFASLSNDAWYGWSAAAAQHFDLSVFRAVEQRRAVVRATNTGISGIIDPLGRAVIRGRLFEPAILAGEIRLGRGRTVYGLLGDWFPALCAAVVLLMLGKVARR